MDDPATLARFKKELQAPYPFLSDPDGKLAELFGVRDDKKAKRRTFVIGEERKILHTQEGLLAIEPGSSIAACPLRHR